MPEGPSLVILREEAQAFSGRTIVAVDGNSTLDIQRLAGQRIRSIRSWGKHLLIELDGFSLRVHLMLFGSYRINARKDSPPRLSLQFDSGEELNFYACSLAWVEQPLDEAYDWRGDIMSVHWSPALALKKLRAMPSVLACDALLDQNVFAGAGNIFKNEVLFRIRVHPLSQIGALSPGKLRQLVAQMRVYGGEFLAWKKAFILRKQWLAHAKRACPRCKIPFSRGHLGKTKRRSFFCERCQKLYRLP